MRVAYQDRWILVVDKPPGLPTQSTRAGEEGLFERLKSGHPYVALHHRLDRPASGLVLLALHERANAGLAAAFREHRVDRTYRAVFAGDLGGDCTWDAPLESKTARTEVRVLGRASGFTAAEVRLHTGRTHQIRRHAAMAGVPVAGDRRYGGEAGRAWPRLALHAWRLALRHPVGGQRLDVESPLPEDLLPLWTLAGGRAMSSWHPIVAHRDFWDVPRMFGVQTPAGLLLFDCPFDESLDEYPETFTVSLLDGVENFGERTDLTDLPGKGRVLGSLRLAQLEFDATRRAQVRWERAASERWTAVRGE